MKKIITFAAIAILASVACTKEQTLEQLDPAQINPQTQTDALADGFAWYEFQAGIGTRTARNGEKVLWSAGDRIKVIYGEGNDDFALSEEVVPGADASSASFKVALPASLSDDATVYAVYPSGTEASMGGSGINVVVPTEQNAGFESADIVVAASKVSSRTFSFKQVCGLISFEISAGNPKAVSKAQFKDLFETELAGTLALSFDAAGAVSFGSVSDGHSSITLSGVKEGTNYIAVLPGAALQSVGLKLGTNDAWLTPLCSDTDYTAAAGTNKPLGIVDTKVGDAYYIKAGATGTGTSWEDAAGESLFAKLMSTPGSAKADTYLRRAACWQLDQQEIRVAEGTYEIPQTEGYDGLFSQLEIDGFEQRATYAIKGGYDAGGRADSDAKATFSGKNSHRIFWLEDHANVTFENIVFTGGRPGDDEDTEGGALKLRWLSVTLENCDFTLNDAAYGAAVYYNNGSGRLSIKGCSFSGNAGGRSIVEMANAKELSLTECSFKDNSASWGSGSIINLRDDVTADIADCEFSGSNKSVFRIFLTGGKVTMNGCRFSENKTSYRGACILHGGTIPVFVNNCFFEESTYTDGIGKGLCISMESESRGGTGKLGLNNCTIHDTNSVDKSGMGVVYTRGKSIISNCTIIGSGDPAVVTYGSSDDWGNTNGSVLVNNIIAQNAPNWGAPRFENSDNGYKVVVSYNIHTNFGGDESACAIISNDLDVRKAWSDFSPTYIAKMGVFDYSLPEGYSYVKAPLADVAAAIRAQSDFGQDFYEWLVSVNGLSKDAAGNTRTDANNRQGALVLL